MVTPRPRPRLGSADTMEAKAPSRRARQSPQVKARLDRSLPTRATTNERAVTRDRRQSATREARDTRIKAGNFNFLEEGSKVDRRQGMKEKPQGVNQRLRNTARKSGY